jgi:hypothetical protein
MEGSHSGLVRRPGKSVCLKGHREFESPTLRSRYFLSEDPDG